MPRNLDSKNRPIALIFGLLGPVFLLLAVMVYFLYEGNPKGEFKEVLIPRGSSIAQVTHQLTNNQVITHPLLFKLLARFTHGEKRVRAGEYRFHTGMSDVDALKVLYYDEPIVHQVTVPEGYCIKQIAEVLSASQLVEPTSFSQKALSHELAQKYQLEAPNLEGYLFPDTYTFSRIDGEDRIIEQMILNFKSKTPNLKNDAAQIGMTLEKVMTLASIIEKETGSPEERPIVSSVFHNRLKKGMRLQSDPTTIYAIPDYKGNITKADLLREHPYNTYTISGLPPGPIASPGLAAIDAALHPAKTDYLYFVASTEGKHIFSKKYSDHAREVTVNQVLPGRMKKNQRTMSRDLGQTRQKVKIKNGNH